MSSAPGKSEQPVLRPPYPPENANLGGRPAILPDVPISTVFLVLFLIFGVTHVVILKTNKARAHKFIFNAPLAAFCFLRVVTNSLRIAWAKNPTSINLCIAATVFVYAGTIMLFVIDWFFTQRILRAQHPRLGWSLVYRVIHVSAIVAIVISLFMVIVGAIQPFLTLNPTTRQIDRSLYLAGEIYFAVFCFTPIIVLIISFMIPRHGTDKFGAGRFRNNISILLAAALILSCGSIFRAVISWLPEIPILDAEGLPVQPPWYFSKACFYGFNFGTEIIVVVLYAITRVDVRFHVPDGCAEPGDYTRKSLQSIATTVGDDEKRKRRSTRRNSNRSLESNMTIEEYEGSLFDDSRTLANSLRFPSTVLEVDPGSGNWKMKKVSRAASSQSFMLSDTSRSSSSRDLTQTPPPPLPNLEWPLRDSEITIVPRESSQSIGRGQKGKMSYRGVSPTGSSRTKHSTTKRTTLDREEIINDTFRRLEGKVVIAESPPAYTYNYTSSQASPATAGSSRPPHHKNRHMSIQGSNFTELLDSTNDKKISDGPFHTAKPENAGNSSHAESSWRRHSNHHRAGVSWDLTGENHHPQHRGRRSHSVPNRESFTSGVDVNSSAKDTA